MKQKFIILLTILFVTIIIGMPMALSVSGYVTPLQTVYGSGSCATCHIDPGGGGPRNAYGTLFENQPNHVTDPIAALQAIGPPPGVTPPSPTPTPTTTVPQPSPPTPPGPSTGGPTIVCYVITINGTII